MICPLCNKEMQKAFMPITKKGIEKAGGVILSISQSLMMSHINAYNCKKCRKIIIDY